MQLPHTGRRVAPPRGGTHSADTAIANAECGNACVLSLHEDSLGCLLTPCTSPDFPHPPASTLRAPCPCWWRTGCPPPRRSSAQGGRGACGRAWPTPHTPGPGAGHPHDTCWLNGCPRYLPGFVTVKPLVLPYASCTRARRGTLTNARRRGDIRYIPGFGLHAGG